MTFNAWDVPSSLSTPPSSLARVCEDMQYDKELTNLEDVVRSSPVPFEHLSIRNGSEICLRNIAPLALSRICRICRLFCPLLPNFLVYALVFRLLCCSSLPALKGISVEIVFTFADPVIFWSPFIPESLLLNVHQPPSFHPLFLE